MKLKQTVQFCLQRLAELSIIKCLRHFNGRHSRILQKDVIARIIASEPELTSQQIFDNHWLDIEDLYRKVGWKVKYDKPAYCESYDASFEFTKA